MLNDFLPAIICVAILVGAVLFGWISDHPRIRRFGRPEFVRTRSQPRIKRKNGEPVETSTESSHNIPASATPLH
jgi:hypothetical protein